MKFKRSDEKGSIYGNPTVQSPYFQQAKNLIKILPADGQCDWIKMDYVRAPTFYIDVADNTRDLTNFFPLPFQYDICNEAAKIFAASSRDGNLYQSSSAEIVNQP